MEPSLDSPDEDPGGV